MTCQTSAVLEPNSTADLAAALKSYSKLADATGRSLKVRATHSKFHGTTAFNCPAGSANIFRPEDGNRTAFGAAPDLSVGVLLNGMNRLLAVDPENHRLTVQAGMTVKQLLEVATANGMSVPLGAVPAFADLMVGGVLLTGAHGSNYGGRSNLVREGAGGRVVSSLAAEEGWQRILCVQPRNSLHIPKKPTANSTHQRPGRPPH